MEIRERKMKEFIIFFKESISVKEYNLKFTQISNHAPTMVVDSKGEMNKFVMGISNLVNNNLGQSY